MKNGYVTYRIPPCLRVATVIGLLAVIVSGWPQTLYGAVRDNSSVAYIQDNEDADRMEIVVKNGYIFITVQRATTIKLYTILGQQVMTHHLQPGTTRVKAPARGVYILNAGNTTRRLTIN